MLKKKHTKKSKVIIGTDSYTQNSYALHGTTLSKQKKLSYKDNYINTTFVANKDILITSIILGSGILEEDVAGALEDKAYEELGLDASIEYLIRSIEQVHDGEGRLFQVFVFEKNKYMDIFSNLQKKVKYIDYILPAPLLYTTLYTLDLVPEKGVHCYLYFGMNDTFLTFYKDGKYLYSKSIDYSLDQIYAKYIEISNDTIEKDTFLKTLRSEGMRASGAGYQTATMKLFGEIFIIINDIIIYTKRTNEIEQIDQLYIGSSVGQIIGLDDYVHNYLGLYSAPLEFNFQMETDELYIEPIYLMMAVSGLQYAAGSYDINFTINPRPPSFLKRPSGQFIGTTLAVSALTLLHPLYYYVSGKAKDAQNIILESKEVELEDKVIMYKELIQTKSEELNATRDELGDLQTTFQSKEKTLVSIYEKKVYYKMKSDQIISFASDALEHGVKVDSMESHNDEYNLSVYSLDDNSITSLIEGITGKYHDKLAFVDIEKIYKDKNSTSYYGVLKVGIK